jgi:hypothetical protein
MLGSRVEVATMWFGRGGLASVTEDAESSNDFLQLRPKLLQLVDKEKNRVSKEV